MMCKEVILFSICTNNIACERGYLAFITSTILLSRSRDKKVKEEDSHSLLMQSISSIQHYETNNHFFILCMKKNCNLNPYLVGSAYQIQVMSVKEFTDNITPKSK